MVAFALALANAWAALPGISSFRYGGLHVDRGRVGQRSRLAGERSRV
jgi:hypothetical protein